MMKMEEAEEVMVQQGVMVSMDLVQTHQEKEE